MPIKNYTTKIDACISIGEIQSALAKAGACKIMIDYSEGEPFSIAFALSLNNTTIGYILPINCEGVGAVLAQQKVKTDKAQTRRIAWRNVRDWVLAQLALIEAGNVTADEVFLPYMADKSGATLYQLVKSGRIALPGGNDNV